MTTLKKLKTPAQVKKLAPLSSAVHRSKAEHVAQQILERIIAARMAPGSSFATETELLAQFNVSRPTLRESLKMLESQGVLERRPGPGGGIIVSQPSIETLAYGFSVFLCLHEVPFFNVIKARELIEPALAAEAALNGSKFDFDELEASIERMQALDVQSDQEAFLAENRVFHGIIARASGNRLLEVFWAAIGILSSGGQHGVRYSQGNQAHVIKAHRRILEACRRRDAEAAAIEMEQHVMSLENLVRSRYQHLLKQPTRIVSGPGRAIA
jgi:DNA-binding FadR family transcriptional regulator